MHMDGIHCPHFDSAEANLNPPQEGKVTPQIGSAARNLLEIQ